MMISFFNYLAITEIVGDGTVGTVSTLDVTADLSLNQSTYKCHISAVSPVESQTATLTVFGRYWKLLHYAVHLFSILKFTCSLLLSLLIIYFLLFCNYIIFATHTHASIKHISMNHCVYKFSVFLTLPATIYSFIHVGPPLAPAVLVLRTGYRSVRVGWTRPWSTALAPVTSYKAELLQADGTTRIELATVPVGSTEDRVKTFDYLFYSTAYNARVAAVNSVGQGPWSTLIPFTTTFPDRMLWLFVHLGAAVESVVRDDWYRQCCAD